MNESVGTNPDDNWSWTLLQTKYQPLLQDFFHSTNDYCLHTAHKIPSTQTQWSALLAHPELAGLQQQHCRATSSTAGAHWSCQASEDPWRKKCDILPCTSFPSLPCGAFQAVTTGCCLILFSWSLCTHVEHQDFSGLHSAVQAQTVPRFSSHLSTQLPLVNVNCFSISSQLLCVSVA